MATIQEIVPENDTSDRAIFTVSAALAAVPFAAVGILLFFAWTTSQRFGAWPTYGAPDPTDASNFLYGITLASGLLAVPAALALSVALPVARRFKLHKVDVALIVTALAGCAILIYLMTGNLGTWIAD